MNATATEFPSAAYTAGVWISLGVPKDLILDANFLHIEHQPLAQGSHGQVFRGILRNANGLDEMVAVKKLPEMLSSEHTCAILRELSVLHKIKHPNIMPLKGFIPGHRPCIVSKFADDGSLFDHVHKRAKIRDMDFCLQALKAVSSALACIHSHHYVHRDVKPGNIIMTKSGSIWLADFGLARVSTLTEQPMTGGVGTPQYMPPEGFQGKFTQQSDIWSLAMVIYEMWTGKIPFSDIGAMQAAVEIATRARTPQIDCESMPPVLLSLLKSMWNSEPLKRPSAMQVYQFVNDLLQGSSAQPLQVNPSEKLERQGEMTSHPSGHDTGTDESDQCMMLHTPGSAKSATQASVKNVSTVSALSKSLSKYKGIKPKFSLGPSSHQKSENVEVTTKVSSVSSHTSMEELSKADSPQENHVNTNGTAEMKESLHGNTQLSLTREDLQDGKGATKTSSLKSRVCGNFDLYRKPDQVDRNLSSHSFHPEVSVDILDQNSSMPGSLAPVQPNFAHEDQHDQGQPVWRPCDNPFPNKEAPSFAMTKSTMKQQTSLGRLHGGFHDSIESLLTKPIEHALWNMQPTAHIPNFGFGSGKFGINQPKVRLQQCIEIHGDVVIYGALNKEGDRASTYESERPTVLGEGSMPMFVVYPEGKLTLKNINFLDRSGATIVEVQGGYLLADKCGFGHCDHAVVACDKAAVSLSNCQLCNPSNSCIWALSGSSVRCSKSYISSCQKESAAIDSQVHFNTSSTASQKHGRETDCVCVKVTGEGTKLSVEGCQLTSSSIVAILSRHGQLHAENSTTAGKVMVEAGQGFVSGIGQVSM